MLLKFFEVRSVLRTIVVLAQNLSTYANEQPVRSALVKRYRQTQNAYNKS